MATEALLRDVFLDSTAAFYVCGLNLTENAAYVLLHPLQTMKTMTERALSPLLNWASRQRPGAQVGGVNILCCDFVGGSRFCSLVIGLNYKLLDGEDGRGHDLNAVEESKGRGGKVTPSGAKELRPTRVRGDHS